MRYKQQAFTLEVGNPMRYTSTSNNVRGSFSISGKNDSVYAHNEFFEVIQGAERVHTAKRPLEKAMKTKNAYYYA